jgi:hypothetical protein
MLCVQIIEVLLFHVQIIELLHPSHDNYRSKDQTTKFTPEVKDLKAPIECSVSYRTPTPLAMQQLGKSNGVLAMVGPSKDD